MKGKRATIISWGLLTVMLFLRIPFRGGMLTFGLDHQIVAIIFDIGTYLLTALFILFNFRQMAVFNLDVFALGLIILGKPILTLVLRGDGPESPFTFPLLPGLLEWAIAAGLLVFCIVWRKHLPPVQTKVGLWLVIGLFAGLLTSLVLAYPSSLQIPSEDVFSLPSVGAIVRKLPSEFCSRLATPRSLKSHYFEEFYGVYYEARLRDVWIWLIQAALFMVAHFYYLPQGLPISMWLIVPLVAWSWVPCAWRSRSIAPAIMAHAAGNATGLAFGYFAALIKFGIFHW